MALPSFTQRFQVRFDECGPDGATRASTLLRYVIETAFGHSSAAGFPLAWYDARGLYWLVRRASVDLVRPIPYGAAVDVTTQVTAFHRIWARRLNTIRIPEAQTAAEVIMDWVFTDAAGRPARVPEDMRAAFPSMLGDAELLRMAWSDPPAEAAARPFFVRAHYLDPRNHMNTAAYLDLFEDLLAETGVDPQQRPIRYELEFLRQAGPGQRLEISLWEEVESWALLAVEADMAVIKGRRSRRVIGPAKHP